LATGRDFDTTLVRVLPVLEAGTSWAPLLLLEYAVLFPILAAGLPTSRTIARVNRTRVERRTQRFRADLAQSALNAGVDPREVGVLLGDPDAPDTAQPPDPIPPTPVTIDASALPPLDLSDQSTNGNGYHPVGTNPWDIV
jgi:ABC-type transport system substrate-binding protein